jgi:diguanylate cyclase (GGDEF)-like protein
MLSLLLCDVDHFKKINDVHGHLAGDAVLRDVALQLASGVRPGDAVGRYGGEEFLVILSDCGPESLRHRAEQLRQSIASCSFAGTLQGLSVSISVGAATIDSGATGQNPEIVLSQVDEALYRAKMEGRNRVVITSPRHMVRIGPTECQGPPTDQTRLFLS